MTASTRFLLAAAILAIVFNAAIIVDILHNRNISLYDEGEFIVDISSFFFSVQRPLFFLAPYF